MSLQLTSAILSGPFFTSRKKRTAGLASIAAGSGAFCVQSATTYFTLGSDRFLSENFASAYGAAGVSATSTACGTPLESWYAMRAVVAFDGLKNSEICEVEPVV